MAILVVDDSPAQLLALTTLLEEAGFVDLRLARTAADALDTLAASPPAAIDLILTDLHMPDVDGIEACRRIKALPTWQDIPIIMITSSSETHDLKLAFAAGAMDYITKPANAVELLARVRSALKLKREMDQRKARERELQAVNQRLESVLADLAEQHRLLQHEQVRSEHLLLNILPRPVADRLKQTPGIIAERFDAVTVLFADIVGFTPLAAAMPPEAVVQILNEVFSLFDHLAAEFGLEKIKTIGDAYMVASGLPVPRADHAHAMVRMALAMQAAIAGHRTHGLQVRIGLHTGPVVAGVIGTRKFSYDLWGDTVNTASRMESHGAVGQIQVSEATYRLIQDEFDCEPRGCVPIRGKGEMRVWYVRGPQAQALVAAGSATRING